MRVITRNELAWDTSHSAYVTTYQESYDFGPTDVEYCKGAKGIIGLVAAIAIPFAAPLIASSLVASGAIAAASATFASTAIGVGLGGALGLATGGLQGGLLGAIGGGLGGYFNAPSSLGGAGADLSTSIGSSGLDASGAPVAAVTSDGVSGASSALSGPAGPIAGDFSGLPTDGLGAAGNTGLVGTSNFGQTPLLDTGGASLTGASVSPITDASLGLNGAAPAQPSFLQNAANTISNLSPNVQQAGLKLGTQALGTLLSPTPQGASLGAQADYLKNIQDQNNQVFNVNSAQLAAKNKDASAVEGIATNYDPQYLGNNAATAAKNRDAAGWADTEARLRTSGYSQEAIDAEHNRFNTAASQDVGTAYTGGVAQGTQQQAGLYVSGANLRGSLQDPNAGLAGDYQQLATQSQNRRAATGKSIQDAFGLGDPTIGAKKTVNTNVDPITAP